MMKPYFAQALNLWILGSGVVNMDWLPYGEDSEIYQPAQFASGFE